MKPVVTNTALNQSKRTPIDQTACIKVLCDTVFLYRSLTGARCDETWLMMTLTNGVFLKSVWAKAHCEAASSQRYGDILYEEVLLVLF